MHVDVDLMGGFAVRVGQRAVPSDEWRRRNAGSLVKLLALAPRHTLHREQVIDNLWPGIPVDDAAPRLHKAAHYARRSLGDPRAVVLGGDSVSLFPDADVEVDALTFERAAEAVVARSGPPSDHGAVCGRARRGSVDRRSPPRGSVRSLARGTTGSLAPSVRRGPATRGSVGGPRSPRPRRRGGQRCRGPTACRVRRPAGGPASAGATGEGDTPRARRHARPRGQHAARRAAGSRCPASAASARDAASAGSRGRTTPRRPAAVSRDHGPGPDLVRVRTGGDRQDGTPALARPQGRGAWASGRTWHGRVDRGRLALRARDGGALGSVPSASGAAGRSGRRLPCRDRPGVARVISSVGRREPAPAAVRQRRGAPAPRCVGERGGAPGRRRSGRGRSQPAAAALPVAPRGHRTDRHRDRASALAASSRDGGYAAKPGRPGDVRADGARPAGGRRHPPARGSRLDRRPGGCRRASCGSRVATLSWPSSWPARSGRPTISSAR